MLQLAGLERLSASNFHHFEEKALKGGNLSSFKYETIVNILDFWNNGDLPWDSLTDLQVTEQLSIIKGVGKWTIDMILMYTLKRPNCFPADDFHLKQIMVNLYRLNPDVKLKSEMINVSNGWGEHKSLAVLYLLAWKEFRKVKK